MTPNSIIATARQIINDNDSVLYRQSNDELLRYVNDGLKEASTLAPRYFIATGNYGCVQGQTEQVLTFEDAQELIEVLRIKDGKALPKMDIAALSGFNPNWASDAEAAAQNWDIKKGDPLRFYIYPKAPAMQLVEVLYIRNAGTYALTDTITEVPLSWESAFADYVIYRAESKDDEHVDNGRINAFYASFKTKITGVTPPAPQGA